MAHEHRRTEKKIVSDTELEAFLNAVVNEEYKNPTVSEPIFTAKFSASKVRGVSNFNRMNTHQNNNANGIVLQSVYFSSKGNGWQPCKSRSRVDTAESKGWSGNETMTPVTPILTRIRLGGNVQTNASASKYYQPREEYLNVSETPHESNGFDLWGNHTSANLQPYRKPEMPFIRPMHDLVQRPGHFLDNENTSQRLGACSRRATKGGLDFEEKRMNQALPARNLNPASKHQEGSVMISTRVDRLDYNGPLIKTFSIRSASNKSVLIDSQEQDCMSISKSGNGCRDKEKTTDINPSRHDSDISINNVNSVFDLKSNSLFPNIIAGTSVYKDNSVIRNVQGNRRKVNPTAPRECQYRNCLSGNCFSQMVTSNKNSNISENRFHRSSGFLQENVDVFKDPRFTALCSYSNNVGADLNTESNQNVDETFFKVADFAEVPKCSATEEDTAATPVADNRIYRNSTKPLLLNPAPYQCGFYGCLRRFLKKSLLIRHQKTHVTQKLYICPWKCCGKRFRRRDERKRHYRSHTGEKPYKCQYCGRCFTRSDHKRSHLQICSVRGEQH